MTVSVLHCYADYKWTGPSGPIARLCRELTARGWPSELACAPARAPEERNLPARAREMGVTVHDGFAFSGGGHPIACAKDRKRLRSMLLSGRYDLVHVHGSLDHILVALALGKRRDVPILRADHAGRRYHRGPGHRWLFSPARTDHLVVLCEAMRGQAVDRLRRAPGDVSVVRGAVDTGEFQPIEPPADMRAGLGLADEDVVFALVARVQSHRRFEVLLEAAAIVRQRDPRVKIIVLGRGTDKKVLLDDPVAAMGLEETVYPLGYVLEGYRETLAAADAGLMLVPGSDGSCRAAMELAAMARPLVVAQRGVLSDIVADGETGFVVNDTPENLAETLLEMAALSPEERAALGAAGRERMRKVFSLERQADAVIGVYEKLMGASS